MKREKRSTLVLYAERRAYVFEPVGTVRVSEYDTKETWNQDTKEKHVSKFRRRGTKKKSTENSLNVTDQEMENSLRQLCDCGSVIYAAYMAEQQHEKRVSTERMN